MRKLILSLLLLAFSSLASAQETYSVAVNSAANVAKIDIGRVQSNTAVCARFSLAPSCTQSAACAASFAATGQPATGGSCSSPEAQAANVRIYANSQPGREAYVTNEIVRAQIAVITRQQAKLDFAAQALFCKTATQPQIDTLCAASGLSAGCGICDNFK